MKPFFVLGFRVFWSQKTIGKYLNSVLKQGQSLFAHYDRENIVGSMFGIDTTSSVEPSISVQSLLKVVPQFRRNVLLMNPDEVVTVMPHWC